MKKLLFVCILLIVSVQILYAQYAEVYPTNWWVGMKNNKVQLLIHSEQKDFNLQQVRIQYPGIKLLQTHRFENENYYAIDLSIASNTKPGNVQIEFISQGKTNAITWPLKERRKGNGTNFAQGVTSADFIYLLMPDRFSNGDTTNDRIKGMRDQSLNRDSIFLRHGGDFKGIINHLDYLQDLGITSLWMTPVLENDMPNRTEHGYAFTNHYTIEPRLGGASGYHELSDSLHKRGMKLIQDAVYNHVGSYHFLVRDPPANDWLHRWPAFTQTRYKDQPIFDPHGSAIDKKITVDGWFTKQMPDLNQNNPYVANFLIQHAIWCVEEFGVDGWRIDTYIYNDPDFMNRCNKALTDEYPKITMFGETWVHGTANQAYFAQNTINTPFKSNLQGVTDFQTNLYGINPALTQSFGWTEGVNKLYNTLSNDFLYTDPMRNVIFLDNHDMTRFFSQVNEDVAKQKMGIAWLLTCRGIPQMYYGTEVLMKGISNPDGWVRLDFPGGWQGDQKNAFTRQGLNADEIMIQEYTRKLANFRKKSSALTTGKLMHYVPVDGLYVYFRYDSKQTILCVMNTSEKEKPIAFKNYQERTNGFSKAKDVITGEIHDNEFTIPAKTLWVLELQ